MNSKVFRIAMSAVFCAVLLLSRAVMAQEYGAVVSISSLQKLTAQLGTLTKDLDPQISGVVQSLPVLLPPGLDLNLPGGLVANDDMGVAIAVPAANAAMLKPVLEQQLEGFEIVEKGKYLIASQGGLEVSGSPAAMFQELAGEYTLAAKLSGGFLAQAVPMIAGLSGQEVGQEELAAMQKEMESVESILMGVNVTKNGDLALDFITEFVEDSETAQMLDKAKNAKTMLSVFYDEDADAAFQILGAMTESTKKMYAESLSANDTTDGLVPALMENVFAGDIVDVALSFTMNEDQPQLLLAAKVQDGEEVDGIVAKMIQQADGKVAESGKKMKFYTAKDSDGATLAVATHAKYIFVAVGDDDVVATLKKTIAKSSKAPKESLDCAARGFANLEALSANPDFAGMDLGGTITFVSNVEKNSSVCKIVADHDCIATIAQLAMAAQAAAAESAGSFDVEELGDDDDDDDDDDF